MAITASVVAAFAQQGATAPNVDVAWSAPAGCPSRAAVLAEVQTILEGGTATAHPVASA